MPYFSSKSLRFFFHLILPIVPEKNGKTLHLLKANSKPAPAGRQRKKIAVLGTFAQYKESKKKPVPQAQPASAPQQPPQPPIPSSIMQFMAPQQNAHKDAKNAKDAKMSGK